MRHQKIALSASFDWIKVGSVTLGPRLCPSRVASVGGLQNLILLSAAKQAGVEVLKTRYPNTLSNNSHAASTSKCWNCHNFVLNASSFLVIIAL